MDQNAEFSQMFSQMFNNEGLRNIKFFINPERRVSADEIRADAVAFQKSINEGRVKEVAAVD